MFWLPFLNEIIFFFTLFQQCWPKCIHALLFRGTFCWNILMGKWFFKCWSRDYFWKWKSLFWPFCYCCRWWFMLVIGVYRCDGTFVWKFLRKKKNILRGPPCAQTGVKSSFDTYVLRSVHTIPQLRCVTPLHRPAQKLRCDQWRNRRGEAECPSETSDREMEHKERKIEKRECGKLKMEGGTVMRKMSKKRWGPFFFFSFHFSNRLKFVLGLPKWEFSKITSPPPPRKICLLRPWMWLHYGVAWKFNSF